MLLSNRHDNDKGKLFNTKSGWLLGGNQKAKETKFTIILGSINLNCVFNERSSVLVMDANIYTFKSIQIGCVII